VLYATAQVHSGWDKVKADGIIRQENKIDGGHAFAIVAYDRASLWMQNSWGEDWGRSGFARISHNDRLVNGTDVWVARLGVPVESQTGPGAAVLGSAVSDNPAAYTHDDLRPHIISLGNNGELRTQGTFGSTAQSVQEIFEPYVPKLTAGWKKKRILVHAHGGLVSEPSAIQRVADVREPLLAHEVYPLAFVWKSDFWTTLQNILRDALARRTVGGVLVLRRWNLVGPGFRGTNTMFVPAFHCPARAGAFVIFARPLVVAARHLVQHPRAHWRAVAVIGLLK
jgi:hypothetical protein